MKTEPTLTGSAGMNCSPLQFTYELWACSQGYGGYDVFDHKTDRPRHGFLELGRCDGMKLPTRPREGQAVMLWDEAEQVQFWLHLPLSVLA